MSDVKDFGMRIRLARIAKRMKQEELGALIGKSTSTVSCYEKGKRQPGIETVKALADALGVSASELAGLN